MVVLVVALLACGGSEEAAPSAPVETPAASAPPAAATTVEAAPASAPAAPALTPIAIPADGKLEMVKVAGVTVPMINIMDGGTVVLVDTDGIKPRSWEEQYKRKSADLPSGYFDLHKSNTNKNDTFEDDEIDKMGRWKMDGQGNIVQD